MALADISQVAERVVPDDPTIPPQGIAERIKRGKDADASNRPIRTEALRFWRGEQYWYRSGRGALINQNTVSDYEGRGKPRHRVRTTRNILLDIVAHEVAAATQRVPSYEINPSTSDPEDVAAARLSGKVARYGYDKWRLRSVTERVATYAVVADEGFAWPFWDSSVGPYFTEMDETGQEVEIGQGEVNVRIFGGNEVFWEPGLKWDESPWIGVQQAQTVEKVQQMEGYFGGQLKPDAQGQEDSEVDQNAKLVLVTDYLERPSPSYPRGRWITLANAKQIVPEREYPCQDHEGNVLDEPVLHKLSYITDPDKDRDMGLVRHLVDPQRTINDATNKTLEWKNLMMNPQIIIRNGEFKQQLTDEPGAVYHAVGPGEITIREVPNIPPALERIKQDAISDMARISAQNDIPSQVESGRGIQALIERDQSRRATFIANLAEFHSRLMRHCLYLVQQHYTEPRLLTIQGRRGPRLIHGFMGAKLRGQANVTVLPGSIEPRTRAQITQLILAYADRGWIDPETAMVAVDNGTAEGLIESLELDESRANEIIQAIEDDAFDAQPPRPVFPEEDAGYEIEPEYMLDELTGEPMVDGMGQPIILKPGIPATSVPGWLPRPFDRTSVHKAVFEDWMKGQDWALLSDDQKQAGMTYYSALLNIEATQAQKAAMQQEQQAQALGMANASVPRQASPSPDQRNPEAQEAF